MEMARATKGKGIAETGKRMSADYGVRAGMALNHLVRGPHRDKAVARLLGVSVRMAKYLRAGQFWTTARLSQAGRLIDGFDAYLASPEWVLARLDELAVEVERLREAAGGGSG